MANLHGSFTWWVTCNDLWGTPYFPLTICFFPSISSSFHASFSSHTSQPIYLLSNSTSLPILLFCYLHPQWGFKAAYISPFSSIYFSQYTCDIKLGWPNQLLCKNGDLNMGLPVPSLKCLAFIGWLLLYSGKQLGLGQLCKLCGSKVLAGGLGTNESFLKD